MKKIRLTHSRHIAWGAEISRGLDLLLIYYQTRYGEPAPRGVGTHCDHLTSGQSHHHVIRTMMGLTWRTPMVTMICTMLPRKPRLLGVAISAT